MTTIYGISSNQIIPQPDFDAVEGENGGITATQSFKILKTGLDISSVRQRFAIGTFLSTLDPDCLNLLAFLQLTRVRSAKVIEGGYMMVSCDFTGYTSSSFDFETGEPDPQPTFSKRGTVNEAPLSEHPKWRALSDTEKFGLGLLVNGDAITSRDFTTVGNIIEIDGVSGFTPFKTETNEDLVLTGDAIQFAKIIAQGITTYKQASVSYVHTWESNRPISSNITADLGRISEPAGNTGTPPGGRNWMLIGVNQTQTGSGEFMFKNELEYILSDRDGHDEFLYKEIV